MTAKLKIFIAILSLVLTIVLMIFYHLPKYTLQVIEKVDALISNTQYYFADLDHDGFSETIRLKYNEALAFPEPAAVLQHFNGTTRFQFDLGEKWMYRGLMTGDYDHNGYDEVFVFTTAKDSVFLYAINYLDGDDPVLRREYITHRTEYNAKEWDVALQPGFLMDADHDGFKDIVFGLTAGKNLQPRKLYIYSIRKRKMIAQSPRMGAYITGYELVDLDGDRREEIVASSPAFRNYDTADQIPYNDNKSWLFAFNDQLDFFFDPLGIDGQRMRSKFSVLRQDGRILILFLTFDDGDDNNIPILYVVNASGETVLKKSYALPKYSDVMVVPGTHRSNILLFSSTGLFYRLDENFQVIGKRALKTGRWNLYPREYYNLFDDGSFQIIKCSESRLCIIDSDLESVSYQKNPFTGLARFTHIRYAGPAQKQVMFQSDHCLVTTRIEKSNWFRVRYVLYAGFFVFIYLTLYGIHSVYKRFLFAETAPRAVFNNAGFGILRLDGEYRVDYCNRAFESMTRLREQDIIGQNFSKCLAVIPVLQKALQENLGRDVVVQQELQFSTLHSGFKGLLKITPIYGIFHIAYAFFIELHDYTLPIEQDRFKVWSKTAQKLAHDIKTPLSSVSLNIQTLQYKIDDIAPQARPVLEKNFELLQTELKRLSNMSKSFMKFVDLEKPALQYTSLTQVVRHAAARFDAYFQKDIKLEQDIDPQADRIYVDPPQFETALSILFENAIDAIKGRGMIKISATLAQDLNDNNTEWVEIDVADTGKGIAPGDTDKIFEPFYSTKTEGTGMGLAIVKKIIRDHGGKIQVSSRVDFATIFKVMLPFNNTRS